MQNSVKFVGKTILDIRIPSGHGELTVTTIGSGEKYFVQQ